MIDQAVRKVAAQAKSKKIKIQVKEIDHTITGDYSSLVELFTIFLDNAIKYSDSGKKINIWSKLDKGSIVVSIKDEGIGISEKEIPHLFDRFYRANNARTKSDSGGYGLGLSIAKKIVDDHQGSIEIKSKEGVGSTFQIIFPL